MSDSSHDDAGASALTADERKRRLLCQWTLAGGLATLGAAARAQGTYGSDTSAAAPVPAASAAAPLPAATSGAAPESYPPSPSRLALLMGNQLYPAPFDLPPIHKNVRDLHGALQRWGFTVTNALDVDAAQSRDALDSFSRKVREAPAGAVVLFYFAGHGLQVEAENLLVAAGVNPSAQSDVLRKSSMVLGGDVVGRLPSGAGGLTIAVIDACRTTIRAALKAGDGLNQVEAPPGCLIAFSTAAGKPAIAPAVETQNTFYTASLVKLLHTSSGDTTFSDLFHLVKLDVERTMENHPLAPIRQLAQSPFIAENTQVSVPLAPRRLTEAHFDTRTEEEDWRALQECLWPAQVVKLADAYLQHYPRSRFASSAEVARHGAAEAAAILRRNDIRLYRRSFEPRPDLGDDYRADLLKAARGDKDAAARVGRRWRTDRESGADVSRYEGWLQFAAELGNGIASYELALHYRRADQPQPAARWEARARELGYTPPPTLDHFRK
jgi:hypothetical protein